MRDNSMSIIGLVAAAMSGALMGAAGAIIWFCI